MEMYEETLKDFYDTADTKWLKIMSSKNTKDLDSTLNKAMDDKISILSKDYWKVSNDEKSDNHFSDYQIGKGEYQF